MKSTGRLHRFVYARHGHELMGCKSPVGDSALSIETMITTSRRQGHHREVLSGGSPSANVRADGQKLHRRPGLWASQHNMTKPSGVMGQGKCSGCVRKVHVLIRGDLHGMRPGVIKGVGLRPRAKGLEPPPNPTIALVAARAGVISRVIVQKSAEGIVGARAWNAPAPKARTR